MNDAITIKRYFRSELKEQLIQIRKLSKQLLLWIISIRNIELKSITTEKIILKLIDRAEQFFGIEIYDEVEKRELEISIQKKVRKTVKAFKRVGKVLIFPVVLPLLLLDISPKKRKQSNKKENFYNPT